MKKLFFSFLILSLLLAACQSAAPAATNTPLATAPAPTKTPPAAPRTLTVMTHDSFAASERLLRTFEQQYNVKVQILTSGDAGSALNKAILAKGNPLADVFYGVDNTFLSRAWKEDIFEPYASPALAGIPAEFQLDAQQRALPIDYGDVCLNYDKAFFAAQSPSLPPPQSLEDLLKPEYKGLLVVENPATSSPGLAFLLATIGHFGEDGYLDFWKGLRANDVKVADGWETAYYTEFTRAGGTRPIVVSYNSSPAFEVIFAEKPLDEPPTAALLADETCFRQIEFAGILKGSKNRDLGEKWIDFMLSAAFQQELPLQMFVFPVNPEAKLGGKLSQYVGFPNKTANVSPDAIDARREQWLSAWSETVLK